MAGTVLNLDEILSKDALAVQISNLWMQYNVYRQRKLQEIEEVRKYIFATDTTQTTNSKLPWKNKTTLPKLCQIRDNLYSNYLASLFPKRKWLKWEANNKNSGSKEKRNAILNYMTWCISQDFFKKEIAKLILDYIDFGNVFATIEWRDERVNTSDGKPLKAGYVGPAVVRISPLDIVFNPTAPDFASSFKIIRSLISIGEVKKYLNKLSTPETREAYENLFKYLVDIRNQVRTFPGDVSYKDNYFSMDGFTSFRQYLESDHVELLTFYGDIYDKSADKLLSNYKIVVVDRHKLIYSDEFESLVSSAPVFHVGWRPRQDNLWAMGPLDNLVGLQYRLDHVENLKADAFDLLTFPPLKIKGYVEDFTWGPMQKIFVGPEGDVEAIAPPFQVLQANVEINQIINLMEELAGAPKEAMGFRTPGEKTAYEVQRLENAASRIFQNKIIQFEEHLLEPLLNAMLELARRRVDSLQEIQVWDDEFQIQVFETITPSDLSGQGVIRPVAARHFAEKAELVQNLTNFYNSALGQDPNIQMHLSGIKIADLMINDLLGLKDYEIVRPYIRLSEMADAKRRANIHEESVAMDASTPAGIDPDDFDLDKLEKPINEEPIPGMDETPENTGG